MNADAPQLFPAGYRRRYLPAMTPAQIAALPDRSSALVLLTTGAIEQHGPHLPVGVDAFLGQAWLNLVLARLPAEVSCYVAPPITIGKSNEHAGFPGTLSIPARTLRALVFAIARQITRWGFRCLAVLNTHGGNSPVLAYTLREVEAQLAIRAAHVRPGVDYGQSKQEALYGFHAGELETSWMLALAPELVRMAEARCEYPARSDDPGELRPERAAATFAWATQDFSRSGVIGDATTATAEKGRRWLELAADGYAARLTKLWQENRRTAAAR